MGLENSLVFLFGLFNACVFQCTAFYLPGLAPVSYCEPGKKTSPGCSVSVLWDLLVIFHLLYRCKTNCCLLFHISLKLYYML